jgi:hypothetical protein
LAEETERFTHATLSAKAKQRTYVRYLRHGRSLKG